MLSREKQPYSPWNTPMYFSREIAIRIWWRAFHLLYGGNKSLAETGKSYRSGWRNQGESGGIEIVDRDQLTSQIDALRKSWKWVIIFNHDSGIFADYLPHFWLLWDDILKNAVIYTADFNLPMNTAEFPGYDFRVANPQNLEGRKRLLEELKNIGDKYVIILPAWPGKDPGNKPFQALFSHILKATHPDARVLAFHTKHSIPIWYEDLVMRRLWGGKFLTTIQSSLTSVSQWPKKWWVEQRSFYNGLF